MTVSVIIPTYNGVEKIIKCLNALEKQSFKDFEVLVVVDGSVDNTLEILTKRPNTFTNFTVINQENKGRSVSRNAGARMATGDLYIFFDDDMRPEPNCVAEHVKHHDGFSNSIMVGAQLEDYKVLKSDVQRYKAHLSRKWSKTITGLDKPLTKEQLFLTAANFSITRELFFSLNGFDERLTDAEDFDLGVRAFLKNIPIYYNHEALAWHDDFITCQSYINRLHQYKAAHNKLKVLKPILYKDFAQHQPLPPARHKQIVYNVLANKVFIKLIDNEKLKTILPEKLRFKLYDLIITSQII